MSRRASKMKFDNLIFLDLETTGTSTVNDRIVQIATYKVSDGENPKNYLINPGIKIPAEATAVHGITDEMVQGKPYFKQIAKSLANYLQGFNVCGFNILGFDIPLLLEEFFRADYKWDISNVLFFDAYKIFQAKEKRDLANAVRFYCGKDHTDAHDAYSDIMATAEVFGAQVSRYEDLREMSELELAEFCAGGKTLDVAGKIILKDGVACYSFGKSAGKPVLDDIGFANWMLKPETGFSTNTKEVIQMILNSKK